jgi:hypothetical protein
MGLLVHGTSNSVEAGFNDRPPHHVSNITGLPQARQGQYAAPLPLKQHLHLHLHSEAPSWNRSSLTSTLGWNERLGTS